MSTTKTTGWLGWGLFAGAIILISGVFSVIQGFVGLIAPDTYYVKTSGSLFVMDVQGWAWWTLIIGILLVLTALALFAGQTWARVVAVILASLSAIGNLLLVPAQPWWSLILIGVDILVIYALTAHGNELGRRD
ncbi:MAG TPA: hypothetical protein VGI08_01820 [Diaminobutyricibacter sp.]